MKVNNEKTGVPIVEHILKITIDGDLMLAAEGASKIMALRVDKDLS